MAFYYKNITKPINKFQLSFSRTAVDLVHIIHGPTPTANSSLTIFTHGLLGSKRNLQSISKRIAKETQQAVIAVDLRNHGESPHADSHTYLDLAGDVSALISKLTEKPVVMMGHSMGGRTAMVLALTSKRSLQSSSKRIAKETQQAVIAVDLRNHGESPHADSHTYLDLAGDVSALISKLTEKPVVMMGHSMGGRTAMVLALSEPNKVASLIVVDISPASSKRLQTNYFPNLINAMAAVDFKGSNNVRQAREIARGRLRKSIKNEATLNFLVMNIGERPDKSFGWICNVNTLKKYFPDISKFPAEMDGKQYKGPTLFIGSDRSDFIPREDLQKIKGYFPEAILKYISKAGHNVHTDNPADFINVVSEFINKQK